MDELEQQESALEEQLEQAQGQLAVVEGLQLSPTCDTNDAEFLKLKGDLNQLIELTKEGLLEVKKQKLLLSLQCPVTEGAPLDSNSSRQPDFLATDRPPYTFSDTPDIATSATAADDEDSTLRGMKCCAPIAEAWGAVNYHNAMIVGKEPADDDTEDDFSVRVLFTTPTYNAMKPCDYFLEGRCRYGDGECKFSHGHVIKLSELLPYQEPDFSLVCIGGRCRAKHTDGLWYDAVVSSVEGSMESITVHFTKLNITATLDSSSVLPLDSSSDDESYGEDGDGDNVEGDSSKVDESSCILEWEPTGPERPLGEWEKHTTGIGSRLMAKMGYEIGKGLGRDQRGRVEPVDIVILPSGKSLDVCVQMREKKKLKNALGEPVGKRRKKRPSKKIPQGTIEGSHTEQDVFQFLNKKIARIDKGSVEEVIASEKRRHCQPAERSENINLKLFRTHEEIKTVQRNLQKFRESLSRQKGDKVTEAHYKDKIANEEKQLQLLQQQEKTLQNDVRSKKEQRKLSIF